MNLVVVVDFVGGVGLLFGGLVGVGFLFGGPVGGFDGGILGVLSPGGSFTVTLGVGGL